MEDRASEDGKGKDTAGDKMPPALSTEVVRVALEVGI